MTQPLLFSGIVSMQRQRTGTVDIQNEHYAGWYASRDHAVGAWITHATERHAGYMVGWHAAYDITDVALMHLDRRPDINVE